MSNNDDIHDALEAIREHAEKIGVVASDLEEASTVLSQYRRTLLTQANAIETALQEEPPPPPPPAGDLFTEIPGRLWSIDHRSRIERDEIGELVAILDPYTSEPAATPPIDLPTTIGHRTADTIIDDGLALDGSSGGWLIGSPAARIRTLIVVAQWGKQPGQFAKIAGADAEENELGGFALGRTNKGDVEAWANDVGPFHAVRAPLDEGRPVLHGLRIYDQSIRLYADGYERERVYGVPISPFTGPLVLLAGWWKHEVVDSANALIYAAHAYSEPISDADLERIVNHYRELAPPVEPDNGKPPPPVTDADITITIAHEPAQMFSASGFSISMSQNPYLAGKVGRDSHAFNGATFSDLRANMVRWWYDYDLSKFVRAFVESGVSDVAREQGVAVFLLAPTPYNGGGRTPPNGWQSGDHTTRFGIERAAATVASHIRALRDQHGMVINATGMLNEPGSGFRTDVKSDDYIFQINTFRSALDQRGLQDVKLIGLEWQPPSGRSTSYAQTIAGDAKARENISGISSHSYGIGIQEADATIARKTGWEYWQTEAGGALSGSDVAARWLADVNHACTHWVFFLGPDRATSQHTLTSPGNPVNLAGHYWALKMLWNAFPPGTVIHPTSSSAEGSMRFFRADKKLYATAGRRPDGKWVIGLVNVTGNPENQWRRFKPSEHLDVAVQLADGTTMFDVQRARDGDDKIRHDQPARSSAGTTVIDVPAREVVCLVEQ